MPSIDEVFSSLDADSRMRLGPATGGPDETVLQGGVPVGRRRRYSAGVILWRQSSNEAYAVYGAIYSLYAAQGEVQGGLGWPRSNETAWEPRGRVSHFERADIFWNGAEAYIVFAPPPPRPSDPTVEGQWHIAPWSSGVVGVHAALLASPPRVLFFTFRPPDDPRANPAPQRYGQASIVDLASGRRDSGGPADLENVFCSGHAFDHAGRLIVAGGEREQEGVRSRPVNAVFAVDTARTGGAGGEAVRWNQVATTRRPRWYPTCAPLHDGGVIAVGGLESVSYTARDNFTFEVIPAGIARGAGAPPALSGPTGVVPYLRAFASYPFVYVLPNRKVLVHAGRTTQFIDTASWTVEPAAISTVDPDSRTYGSSGTSVMLPLRSGTTPPYQARIMLIGGGRPGGIAAPASRTCEILDMGATPLAWRAAAPMTNARVMPDAVLLPDGTVFVTNGSASGHADAGAAPVYDTEIYDPVRNHWRRAARMQVPRLYHATALLLPDGRVLTAGTDASWNPPPFNRGELRVELYSPPYMFRGARPVIEAAPENVGHGQRFEVRSPQAEQVDACALVRAGSVTHSFNPDQRWVESAIVARAPGRLTLAAPPDGYVAPPGYYLLFLLRGGIPSVGRFIQIGAPALERRLTVNADTGATLLTIPGVGAVLVSASDPATSSLTRFVNGSGQPLRIDQELTPSGGAVARTAVDIAAGAVHSLSLHAAAVNRWTLVWRVAPRAGAGPSARIELAIANAPESGNFVTYSARVQVTGA